jgi:hypothetical protein
LKFTTVEGLFKFCAAILGLAVFYVLVDYTIDIRPSRIQSSYHFGIESLPPDVPVFLRQDNLVILVIARSATAIADLQQVTINLQDAESMHSNQPAYAANRLRSRHADYFVSYAMGTNLGCMLQADDGGLREICSNARYDHAGRALKDKIKFPNLVIPDYNFSNDFKMLTIKP